MCRDTTGFSLCTFDMAMCFFFSSKHSCADPPDASSAAPQVRRASKHARDVMDTFMETCSFKYLWKHALLNIYGVEAAQLFECSSWMVKPQVEVLELSLWNVSARLAFFFSFSSEPVAAVAVAAAVAPSIGVTIKVNVRLFV